MSQAQAVPANDDYQEKIDRCAQQVIAFIEADVSFRVPNTEEKRQNAFAEWLAECLVKYRPVIQSELQREFGSRERKPDGTAGKKAFETQAEEEVWKQIVPALQSYAVLYQAAAWVRGYMGDATTLDRPIMKDGIWYVSLGVAGYGENLGQIVLDRNGTVVPGLTSTRQQILEKIDDREFSPLKAAARQQ